MSATRKMLAASSALIVLTTGLLFIQPAEATLLIQIDDTTSALAVSLNLGTATCSVTVLGSPEQVEVDCPLAGGIGSVGISTNGTWDITIGSGQLDISATLLDSPTIVSDIVDLNFTANLATNTTAFHFNFESCGETAPCGLVALGPGALETAETYSAIVTGIGPEPIDVEVKFAPDAHAAPEPTTFMLVGLGFAGLAWSRHRKLS
jgi:PEP-CTERM motif